MYILYNLNVFEILPYLLVMFCFKAFSWNMVEEDTVWLVSWNRDRIIEDHGYNLLVSMTYRAPLVVGSAGQGSWERPCEEAHLRKGESRKRISQKLGPQKSCCCFFCCLVSQGRVFCLWTGWRVGFGAYRFPWLKGRRVPFFQRSLKRKKGFPPRWANFFYTKMAIFLWPILMQEDDPCHRGKLQR